MSNFGKLNIGYHLSKFQISWLFGSNFMEVNVRPQNTIMTSFMTDDLSCPLVVQITEVLLYCPDCVDYALYNYCADSLFRNIKGKLVS